MDDTIRPGETSVDLPAAYDASLYFIGRIRTPWQRARAMSAPRRSRERPGMPHRNRSALAPGAHRNRRAIRELQILYWMNFARRDLVMQVARSRPEASGTFALRSPARPNPIASSIVTLIRVEDLALVVKGLDCLDMTPLLDIKPHYEAGTAA